MDGFLKNLFQNMYAPLLSVLTIYYHAYHMKWYLVIDEDYRYHAVIICRFEKLKSSTLNLLHWFSVALIYVSANTAQV
jgi:hypothetical protein